MVLGMIEISMTNIILFSYLPALLGMLIIALSVLARQRRPTYVAFALLLFCVIAWLAPQAVSLVMPDDAALWFIRLSFLTCNFIAPLFLLFALLYPNAQTWPGPRSTLLIVAPACLFAAISYLPSLVKGVDRRGGDLILHTGPVYEVQTIYIVGSIVVSLGVLIWKYYHVPPKERVAILMLLFAFIFPLVAGVFANYIWINNPGAQYFVPATIFITALIITYAMVRHRLFDIRLAAVRGAAYVLSLLTLGVKIGRAHV